MSITSLTKPYHTVTGNADCRADLLLRTMINKRPGIGNGQGQQQTTPTGRRL
jgi:hypothetical protein